MKNSNIDLNKLLQTLYKSILGREIDENGFSRYRDLYEKGYPIELLTAEIFTSKESNFLLYEDAKKDLIALARRYSFLKKIPLGKMRWRLLPHIPISRLNYFLLETERINLKNKKNYEMNLINSNKSHEFLAPGNMEINPESVSDTISQEINKKNSSEILTLQKDIRAIASRLANIEKQLLCNQKAKADKEIQLPLKTEKNQEHIRQEIDLSAQLKNNTKDIKAISARLLSIEITLDLKKIKIY